MESLQDLSSFTPLSTWNVELALVIVRGVCLTNGIGLKVLVCKGRKHLERKGGDSLERKNRLKYLAMARGCSAT